jgi:hypothetical protein
MQPDQMAAIHALAEDAEAAGGFRKLANGRAAALGQEWFIGTAGADEVHAAAAEEGLDHLAAELGTKPGASPGGMRGYFDHASANSRRLCINPDSQSLVFSAS